MAAEDVPKQPVCRRFEMSHCGTGANGEGEVGGGGESVEVRAEQPERPSLSDARRKKEGVRGSVRTRRREFARARARV